MISCNRIDGEVASREVLFQSDAAIAFSRKTGITGRDLPLPSGKGIFLSGKRMKKNRKIFSDLTKTKTFHFGGIMANDDPVSIGFRQA